jgi:hypothetical protein
LLLPAVCAKTVQPSPATPAATITAHCARIRMLLFLTRPPSIVFDRLLPAMRSTPPDPDPFR